MKAAANPVTFRTLQILLRNGHPDHSVLIQGPHGIGKSAIVNDLRETFAMPVIDLRLSLMTEGDMLGVPNHAQIHETGVTVFAPPEWLHKACTEPVILFLDEFNRANPQVQNSAFQLVLDRAVANHKLHPKTRVFAAINIGQGYHVPELDIALRDRFAIYDLVPDLQEWLVWARTMINVTVDGETVQRQRIDGVICDFLHANPGHWIINRPTPDGTITPSPRSWHRLNDALCLHDTTTPSKIENSNYPAWMYPLCAGYVGLEATSSFIDFVKDASKQISHEDILDIDKWNSVKHRVAKLSPERITQLGSRLIEHIKSNNLKIFKHHFGVGADGKPFVWDNAPVSEGDVLFLPHDNDHGGGLQEFIMSYMNDELFLSFYLELAKGMQVPDPKNITGWARFFVSLHNFGGFPMEQSGGKENRIGLRFVRIQELMIPDDQKA